VSNAKLKRLQKLERIVERSRPAAPDYDRMSATERVRRIFKIFHQVAERTNQPFPFQAEEEFEAATDPATREQLAQSILQQLGQMQRQLDESRKDVASGPGTPAGIQRLAAEIGGRIETAADFSRPRP